MGKIYCLIGKSATGKDTLYRQLIKLKPQLGTYVMYTTRQMREGEQQGVSYYFTGEAELEDFRQKGRLIESRTYDTVYGPWTYATVDDGQIDLKQKDYLMTGTLASLKSLRSYYGDENVIPVYIEIDDGERLMRAVKREMTQKEPKYKELCRRFLADAEDFSEENIITAGITRRFRNDNLKHCAEEIIKVYDL